MTFAGDALRAGRREAGLSRRRLAELVRIFHGVTVSEETLRRHEAGISDPRWSHVRAYAYALGVDLRTFDPTSRTGRG